MYLQPNSEYKNIPLAALFAALAVIFPVFFHLTGLGSKFLPMYFPLVFGAFVLPLKLSLSIVFLSPVVSYLFTSMPPLYPPILPTMLLELLIICTSISLFYKKFKFSIWISLILSLIIGRLILFIFVYYLAPWFDFPGEIFSVLMVVQGIPGIILMLAVIPFSIKFLNEKYPQIFEKAVDG